MSKLTTKPKCVLLDANVVIVSHELGIWEQLKTGYRITLPAIVRRDEVLYYYREGHITAIDLEIQISNKEIDELEASGNEIQDLLNIFEPWFVETLDPGETEALALLNSRDLKNVVFCSSDAPAIKALAMIKKSSQGISYETMLTQIGLNKTLKKQYTENFFKDHTKQGAENFVTRNGLKNKHY
jgi:hypothetical protein